MRVAPDTAELIKRAAAARGESVTSFVLDAATKAAEAELVAQRETLVPATFFDDLLAALDAPDEAPAELARLAAMPRAYKRA
jgi:uncharacterized protein (DUF1778 family)